MVERFPPRACTALLDSVRALQEAGSSLPGWFGLVRTNGAVTTSYDGTPLQVNLDI
jgi:hypothetical protein